MAHSDGRRRYGDSPKTPTTPTMEQLLQAGDPSWWSASTSPTTTSPRSAKDHDPEDHNQHHKKSVLSKVKEKAKKLRHSLSKKKNGHDGNTTPSWGVSLDDEDEDDPEYFGAPMYESELAPEGHRETTRQHPREVPVVPETQETSFKDNINQGKDQKTLSPITTSVKHNTYHGIDQKPLSPNMTSVKHNTYHGKDQKPPSPNLTNVKFNNVQEKEKPPSPNKALTETVTEKLAPAYATVSEATHAIASKIQGLAVSSPTEPAIGEHACSSEHKWDKGVSVKEYLVQKFEPGEDERALSQAISDAMSPRKSSGDVGVVEKVKEAVSSLLRTDESTPSTNTNTNTTTSTKASSHIPITINDHEAMEEENHGRILQAN